jgi:hypothetical protein
MDRRSGSLGVWASRLLERARAARARESEKNCRPIGMRRRRDSSWPLASNTQLDGFHRPTGLEDLAPQTPLTGGRAEGP